MERRPPPSVTVPQTPKFSDAGKASLQNWRRQRSKVIDLPSLVAHPSSLEYLNFPI